MQYRPPSVTIREFFSGFCVHFESFRTRFPYPSVCVVNRLLVLLPPNVSTLDPGLDIHSCLSTNGCIGIDVICYNISQDCSEFLASFDIRPCSFKTPEGGNRHFLTYPLCST